MERRPEEHSANKPVTGTRSRILLVCPDSNFHRTLQRILCRCGYEVEVAASGEEALERASRAQFDAVMSQVHLPGAVCGVTLLDRLRRLGIGVPVVMLTERETSRLRQVVECANDATCVSKDGDLDLLKATLASFLSPARRV